MQRRSNRSGGPGEPDGPAVDGALERRLRSSLDPPPGAAARIARAALTPEASSGRAAASGRRLAVAWLVSAAVAALAMIGVLLGTDLRFQGDQPTEHRIASATTARYSITNRGEVLIVQSLDGGPSSLRSTNQVPGRPSAPTGMRLMITGGSRP